MMPSDNRISDETVKNEAPAKSGPVAQTAIRFAAVYFTLLFLPWPVSALLVSDRLQKASDLLQSGVTHAWKPLVDFAAANIFHVGQRVAIAFADTRSGDRLFDWLVNFWVLVIATAVTVVWTVVQPRDAGLTGAYLRVYLRYTLGAVMLTYGSVKLSQFPPPFSSVLNKTFGEETPMGLLWTFIGASTGYTVCIGLLEVLCGALLLFRRTTLLGACLAFALTLNIFLLNVFYDVPVKLFSFHLVLAALVLLAPDLGRLVQMFLMNRTVPARRETHQARPYVQVFKILLLVYLLGWDTVAAVEGYVKRTTPKSPIEGIWKVASFTQDGREVSELNQGKLVRWQWLTIDKFGGAAFCHLWFVDGSVASGQVTEKPGNVLTFAGPDQSQSWTFHLMGPDELTVGGVLAGVPTSVQLRRNQSWTSLVRHKTHWIQEAPREP